MDCESERGLRTGNRGPEIGNRKKDPESGTGRIGTGKGTGNLGKETGSRIGNRIRDWGAGPGNETGKQDLHPRRVECVQRSCTERKSIRWRTKLHPETIIKGRSGLFSFVLIFFYQTKMR